PIRRIPRFPSPAQMGKGQKREARARVEKWKVENGNWKSKLSRAPVRISTFHFPLSTLPGQGHNHLGFPHATAALAMVGQVDRHRRLGPARGGMARERVVERVLVVGRAAPGDNDGARGGSTLRRE